MNDNSFRVIPDYPVVLADYHNRIIPSLGDFFYSDESSYAVQGLMNLTDSFPTFADTDTPTLLKAYVDSVRFGLKIDPPNHLKVDYAEGSLIGLNEFLWIKIFELRPVSLEVVLRYKGYQAMQ